MEVRIVSIILSEEKGVRGENRLYKGGARLRVMMPLAIDESWLSRESRHQPLTTPRLPSPFF
jgi:hypothetical protein